MKKITLFALVVCALFLCFGTEAPALTMVSDVGDRDGFNGVYNPDTQTLPYVMYYSSIPANPPSDPAYTDREYFEEDWNPIYNHSFVLPAGFVISSVMFEIVTYDNASESQVGFGWDSAYNGRIFLDGVEFQRDGKDFFWDAVGDLYGGTSDSLGDGAAELYTVSVPSSFFTSFMDGQVAVLYTGSDDGNDGVCVDYTRLTITGEVAPVPEPATMLLLASGLAGLAGLRRKFRKN